MHSPQLISTDFLQGVCCDGYCCFEGFSCQDNGCAYPAHLNSSTSHVGQLTLHALFNSPNRYPTMAFLHSSSWYSLYHMNTELPPSDHSLRPSDPLLLLIYLPLTSTLIQGLGWVTGMPFSPGIGILTTP